MSTRAALFACAIALLPAWPVSAAIRYDPALRFRTISTARFDIHFHQGLELHARRLAVDADRIAADVDGWLGSPSGRVHVILVNQSDLSNGWATTLPHNVIELSLASPPSRSFIGNTDDWLRLVFIHEYTHIVHLDRARGVFGGLRRVFGRMPLLFPNAYTPLWQIEGIATYAESRLTNGGRVQAGDFALTVDRAAASSVFLPLDRAGGGLVDWPAGHAPYAYGGLFHAYLAERGGAGALRELTEATAGRFPYTSAPAFRSVFDRSLGDLWGEFEEERRARAEPQVPSPSVRRLTFHGFEVTGPREGPDGRVYYGVVNPRTFPALMALDPSSQARDRVVDRYLGSTVGFAGREIVFDQVELANDVGLQSDLYAVDPDRRRVRRLTVGARASEPDISPDGKTVVCTILRHDGRTLATAAMPGVGQSAPLVPLVAETLTEFFTPRWSPDGRRIAVERRRVGGPFEIVLVDADDGEVRPLLSSLTVRYVTPAWSPDGSSVVYAAAARGEDFHIETIDLASGRRQRLTGAGPNAHFPAFSRDGRSLAYVAYTSDGMDVFSIDAARAEWIAVEGAAPAAPGPAVRPAEPPAIADARYSPWAALVPRYWMPIAETDAGELVVGGLTSSIDPLGRHAYVVQGGWNTARARPDVRAVYTYDRWWPTLFADVADDTDPWREGEIRSREVNAGVVLPHRRVRHVQSFLAAFHRSVDTFTCPDCEDDPRDARVTRGALRGGWSADAARAFGYSISEEEGWSAGATIELARRGLGADGDAGSATADLRGYLRLGPPHAVVAARVAGATAWGDERARRVFGAAGSGPQPRGFRFGSDAIGLLRGADDDDVFGEHAVVFNLDYRVPLARPQRGLGTLPIFARALHAAVFADAGHAWSGRFRLDAGSRAFGAELSLDAVVGYGLPVTVTAGASWVRTPASGGGVAAFARLGRAF